MFYLLGSPRSGTTILAQCISSHPDLIIPDETDFIVPLSLISDRIKDELIGKELISKLIVSSARFQYSIGEYLSKNQVMDCVESSKYHPASILDAIYSKIAEIAGKKIAGDKSPNDLLAVRQLFTSGTLGAESRIIHIVRDIRDVMASLNKTAWAPRDIDEYFPRMWCSNNLYLNYEKQGHKNYVLVRYEDFARNPEPVLRQICEMLEVPYIDDMLKAEGRHGRYKNVNHHSNIYNPVNSGSVGAYKDELAVAKIAKYEEQSMEALVRFGYVQNETQEKSDKCRDQRSDNP